MCFRLFVCIRLVVLATEAIVGHALLNWTYYNALIVLSVFLLILALGQGTVILTGGLDLSVPWTIALSGIVFAGLVRGSDEAMIYALPLGPPPRAHSRIRQRHRHRRSRPVADRHDAGHERHSPRCGAALFAGHAGRLLLARAPLVHDRQGGRLHAGGALRLPVHRACEPAADAHAIRPARLRYRERPAGRRAVRHLGRPDVDPGLHAVRVSVPRWSAACSPAFPARRASAWATNTCCRRSRWWWSAAR